MKCCDHNITKTYHFEKSKFLHNISLKKSRYYKLEKNNLNFLFL